MPELAWVIVTKNQDSANTQLNFKGFVVGNPFTDHKSGTPAMYEAFWGHQIIDKLTYDKYQKHCVEPTTPDNVRGLEA
jgi:hypothetical protein